MKKILLWILLIFSLFTIVGGLLVIIDPNVIDNIKKANKKR